MRMKWFDRVLFVLVMLVLIAVAVFAIGVALGIGAIQEAFMNFVALMSNGIWVNSLILGLIGALLIVVVLRVLYASCAHPSSGAPIPTTVLLKTTDDGTIRIALSAIDTMVQRSARTSAAVRDVASRIAVTEQDGIAVQLRVVFAPDTILTEATVQIQNDVKEYVQSHAGVPVQEVQIYVDAVGSAQPVRVE